MKTIKEACVEVILDAPCGLPNYEEDDYNAGFVHGVDYGFKAGVEFAQRWISVEEELPEKGEKVLVLLDDNDIQFDSWLGYWFAWHHKVTHWRPIELK